MGDPLEITLKAKITYYCREGYHRAMQNAALEGMKRFAGDTVFRFYFGLSLVCEGRVQEGIRELDRLQSDSEVMLGAMLALIHAHKRCATVDKEAVMQLDAKLKEERKKAGDKALHFAGVFLFLNGRYDKAREYVDRLLKINSQSRDGLVLKGWIELGAGKESKDVKNAINFFESIPNANRDIDAMLGKAKFYELVHSFDQALECLNQLVVSYPSFVPALLEKMKIQLALKDWVQASDSAERALILDPGSLEGKRFKILNTMCHQGNYHESTLLLKEFFSDLEQHEPRNGDLFMRNAQLFSRLCGRHQGILHEAYRLAERAAQLDPSNADRLTELGYQCLLQENVSQALKFFRNATKMDESSISALTGTLHCQLLEGHLQSAEQHLEFQLEVSRSVGTSPEIYYLSALLGRLKGSKSSEEIIGILTDAIETHFRAIRSVPFGVEYLIQLNPDFLLLVVRELLLYAPTHPVAKSQAIPPALERSRQVLEPVTKVCPGMRDGLFLLARVRFLRGEISEASSLLQEILEDIDPTFSDAHVLMAQIQLQQGFFKQASQSLEVGLSYNFEIREHPIYHLIKARIQKKQGQMEEAIVTLRQAMALPGFKVKPSEKNESSPNRLPDSERAAIYLELADALRMNNQNQEAAKVMEEARNEFRGTGEEVRVSVSNADLALARGDVEGAIAVLKRIGPDQPYYIQSREKMASIYLQYRKDRRMYAACYREIVEKDSSPQSYLLLGDALMGIQEPDKAIEVYEQALKRNPRDAILAGKMGQALIKTHQYGKAINYYKESIRNDNNNSLRHDLAELQMKLRQYEKAEKTLVKALEVEGSSNEINSLTMQAKLLALLAKVQEKAGMLESALSSLNSARDIQSRVLQRAQVEQPDAANEQKQLAASICRQMAEHAVSERQHDKAIRMYKEALSASPDDAVSLLALARLYMTVGDLDQCQLTCMTLLRQDKENESATVMMADLAFRKNDYETAMFHFQQILEKKPNNYEALARLVELMRRTGNLDDCTPFLIKAEKASSRSALDAGYHFCIGLHEWYTGNPEGALKSFNKARRDNVWSQRAIRNMIEICLNPDNDTIGGETFESVDGNLSQSDARDAREMALLTAEKLLRELLPKGNLEAVEKTLLENFALMATKNKANIEKALQDCLRIAQDEAYKEHVGAILGVATAYMLLKLTPKARNQLKRVSKNPWSFEDAEYLEKAWLLLADIYVQNGKYDMATEILRRVLEHNKSSTKAYEYMGYIMEKEQSYRDAAYHYEQAWKYSTQANPVIGYKLAFNYMKAKRYVDAIDVSRAVLGKHPDYPKIRKEILEKSRDALRR